MYLTKKIRKEILEPNISVLTFIEGPCYVIKLVLVEVCRTQESIPKAEIMVFF